MYTNLPTSQRYIFRILQNLATKFCSFSNFDNFFPEISFVIPRLKIFLKRKSSIELVMMGNHVIACTIKDLALRVMFENFANLA